MAVSKRARFIYRIENEDGGGPYRGCYWSDMWNVCGERHPTPDFDTELDFKEWRDENWQFGFKSLEQLRFWFYKAKWRKDLARLGMRIVKYRVPAGLARTSDAQALFVRTESQPVLSISLLWL